MRTTFINTLLELAEQDSRIVLLTGDLGYTVMEPFQERFPDRFYNMGVAEQNMVGVATGLAEAGFLPFVYSIVTFATLRPYEFIRNGPVFHHLPVRILGVGGGMEYGEAGTTHHGLEDVGILRIQPGLTVIAPADFSQAREVLLQTWDLPGPIYYRLGKDEKNSIPNLEGRFELEKVQRIQEGREVLLLAMGSVAKEVAKAAKQLETEGTLCTVGIVASISPPPQQDLIALLQSHSKVITVEAHYVDGGLGSLVSEIVAEQGIGCRVVRCGVRKLPEQGSGSEAYLLQMAGLNADSLVETVRKHDFRG